MADLRGTSGPDRIRGASGEENAIEGVGGDDTLFGADLADTIEGGLGSDTLFGAGGADEIDGDVRFSYTSRNGGDDLVRAGDGNDFVRAYAGDDTVFGGDGNDFIDPGPGADLIDGGRGLDSLNYYFRSIADREGAVAVDLRRGVGTGGNAEGDAYRGIETVYGTRLGDTLLGNGRDNNLYGAGGRDSISGRGGNDTIEGDTGPDTLDGGAGRDTLAYKYSFDRFGHAAAVTVNLSTGEAAGGDAEGDSIAGFERVLGGRGGDVLTGDDGANVLVGESLFSYGDGRDRLSGLGGDDRLIGGDRGDVLSGGAGADRFIFRTLGDSNGLILDWVLDFSRSSGDLLDFSRIDADTSRSGDQAFAFLDRGAFTGAGGEVRYSRSEGDTIVYADVDGDRGADFSVLLDGRLTLTADDFVL